MKKVITKLEELILVGTTERTSNKELMESAPEANKISLTLGRYFGNGLATKIKNRKKPGTTFSVFTRYESDVNGPYTYFVGEQVTSVEALEEGLEVLRIPAQTYAKFTSEAGPMPQVCFGMWQDIWKMTPADLGGERAYVADFEVYDERSQDPANTVLDIYLGIKS